MICDICGKEKPHVCPGGVWVPLVCKFCGSQDFYDGYVCLDCARTIDEPDEAPGGGERDE